MHPRLTPLAARLAWCSAFVVAAAIPCAVALAAFNEPNVAPASLRAPPGDAPDFILNAHGVQIYLCRAKPADRFAFEWSFVAPEATLLENDEIVASHGAGPVWESVVDGSHVKGTVQEREDGGAGNIPWLTLAGTPTEGNGRFDGVTRIRRVATRGGVAPGAPCDASRNGMEARVKYSADYWFYKRRPA